jgi:hypothetical protein
VQLTWPVDGDEERRVTASRLWSGAAIHVVRLCLMAGVWRFSGWRDIPGAMRRCPIGAIGGRAKS